MRRELSLSRKVKSLRGSVYGTAVARRRVGKLWMLLPFSNIMTLTKIFFFRRIDSMAGLIFTLACSEFFWNVKTFFSKRHYFFKEQ